jgi:2',3'-cyclic-nucleotide 2'-phosphodiesterase (5'-nucleotidase family)
VRLNLIKKPTLLLLSCFFFGLPISIFTQTTDVPNKKPIFEIIYLANINGNIENCHCGEPSLGGLDRIFTIVKKQRALNPNLVVIDGGDTFNPYSFIELNRVILKAYQIIKPDIWVLSEQELTEGKDLLIKALKKQKSKIVLSNYKIKNIPSEEYQKYTIEKNSVVKIYSYVQPSLFSKLEDLEFNNPDNLFKDLDMRSFNILVFHGEEDALLKTMPEFENFDLILTAHQQSNKIVLNSRPAIIGSGADGENIVHIRLHKSKGTINISAEQIPIGLEIEPDTEIRKWVEEYKNNLQN